MKKHGMAVRVRTWGWLDRLPGRSWGFLSIKNGWNTAGPWAVGISQAQRANMACLGWLIHLIHNSQVGVHITSMIEVMMYFMYCTVGFMACRTSLEILNRHNKGTTSRWLISMGHHGSWVHRRWCGCTMDQWIHPLLSCSRRCCEATSFHTRLATSHCGAIFADVVSICIIMLFFNDYTDYTMIYTRCFHVPQNIWKLRSPPWRFWWHNLKAASSSSLCRGRVIPMKCWRFCRFPCRFIKGSYGSY